MHAAMATSLRRGAGGARLPSRRCCGLAGLKSAGVDSAVGVVVAGAPGDQPGLEGGRAGQVRRRASGAGGDESTCGAGAASTPGTGAAAGRRHVGGAEQLGGDRAGAVAVRRASAVRRPGRAAGPAGAVCWARFSIRARWALKRSSWVMERSLRAAPAGLEVQLVGRRHAHWAKRTRCSSCGAIWRASLYLALEVGDVLRDLQHQVVGVGLGGLMALDGLGVAAEVSLPPRGCRSSPAPARARSVSETGTGMVVLSRRLL